MKADVVVVGAGTTGAAAAAFLAERGLSVVCLERRRADEAGARWVNDVPAAMFDEAGVARPCGEELLAHGRDAHVIAGWGPERRRIARPDVLTVDMRALVARLQARAHKAGAVLRGDVSVAGIEDGVLRASDGAYEARWYVDAGGLAGPRLLGRTVPRADLCVAASRVFRVRDPAALRGYFESQGAAPDEAVNFVGIAGGFSTVTIRSFSGVFYAMAGTVPADGHPPGPEVLRDFVSRLPWVGEPIWGGSRAIPLGATHAELARGNVAAAGDAAGQVFPAHASGVGAGLVAARMLAGAVAAGDPHRYAVQWQRSRGALHAAFEAFRRFSRTLSPADAQRLVRSGLMVDEGALAALEQRAPRPDVRTVAELCAAALREPVLAARLAPYLALMGAAAAHFAIYPSDPARVPAWSRVLERILPSAAADPAPPRPASHPRRAA